MRFPVVLHTDNDTHFGVTVPDLPGCFSGGHSVEHALESVREAIDLHLEGLIEEGEKLPEPCSIAQHRVNPDFTDGLWALIDVDTARFDGRTEKINITIPRRLRLQIDAYAKSRGATRSGFLVEAARRAMEGR